MRLKGIVMLAAQTARSKAYLQALTAHNLYPEQVILLGEDPNTPNKYTPGLKKWQDIILPNLSEPLALTCDSANIPMVLCDVNDVNSDLVAQCIRDVAPDIVIYSGFGGQIVSDRMLQLGPKFLHMHSGWLPDYRGSTTLYYAMLNRNRPGVTALILDQTIDTGPVIARQYYPVPPVDIDLDLEYDTAIRADLLVRVISNYMSDNKLEFLEYQDPEVGDVYYVIHPVLKHIAIMSLSNKKLSCLK